MVQVVQYGSVWYCTVQADMVQYEKVEDEQYDKVQEEQYDKVEDVQYDKVEDVQYVSNGGKTLMNCSLAAAMTRQDHLLPAQGIPGQYWAN